jgi:hypothetical protein
MKIGFFEESEGVRSASRLIMILGCLWTMGAGTVMVLHKIDPVQITFFIGGCVAVFMGGKVANSALTENKKLE